MWYTGPNAASNAIDCAKFFSRSHDAVIRVYDSAGNVIETHEHKGDFQAVSLLAKIVGRFVRPDYSAISVQHANFCVVRARA